jgi:nucleotide-binding universal stress UspA family protein
MRSKRRAAQRQEPPMVSALSVLSGAESLARNALCTNAPGERAMIFRDSEDAGRQLAAKLERYRGERPIVLALPRGGVPVGWRVEAEPLACRPVRRKVVPGAAAVEIVCFATEGDGRYDIIVMGTHGRTGREKVAFGSVAQRVVLDAPCPVLVVHPRIRRPHAG